MVDASGFVPVVADAAPTAAPPRRGPDLALQQSSTLPVTVTDDIVVIAVPARGPVMADQLARTVTEALAVEPRAVLCDLAGVTEAPRPADLEALTAATASAREWAGTLVALAIPDPDVRAAFAGVPMRTHVLLQPSLGQAIDDIGQHPAPLVGRLRLPPNLTSSAAARSFSRRLCLDWGVRHALAAASLVVSELVTNAIRHTVADIELSLARLDNRLRVAVHDQGPGIPRQSEAAPTATSGRGLALVDGFSRAWGVLPLPDAGKSVWAVLDV